MNTVALIVPHYGESSDTNECLESIKKQSIYPRIRIYLTYQSGGEFESGDFKKQNPQVVLVPLSSNLGFAGSCNAGLKRALYDKSDIFVVLNNDVVLGKTCIERLVSYVSTNPKVGIVSPKIYFYSGQEYHHDAYREEERGKVIWYAGGSLDWNNVYASHRGVDEVDHGQFDGEGPTDFATGCCMVITKEVLTRVGFFDEKYFLYYEDTDYSMRCKGKGFEVLYYPCAFLWHKNASSSGKPGSVLHQYYQTRNRLYFGYRYAPLRTKLALFRESMKMLGKKGIKRKAVIDYYIGNMGKRKIL